MFNLFRKDYEVVKIKLSEENNTRLIRLRGLYTYQRSKEVSNSDVVAELLERVEKQTNEEMKRLAEEKNRVGKFIMLVGLRYAGKTTYAHRLAADNPDAVVLSKYDIAMECELPYQKSEFIDEVMNARTLEMLQEGKTVIYDASNLDAYKRKKTLKFLSVCNCRKECIVLNTPADICEQRCKQEGSSHYIEALQQYEQKRMYYPSYNEGWDSVSVIFDSQDGTAKPVQLSNLKDVIWDLSNDRKMTMERIYEDDYESNRAKYSDGDVEELEDTSELKILSDNEDFDTDNLTDFFTRR